MSEPPKKTLKSLLNGFISKKTAAAPKPLAVPKPAHHAQSHNHGQHHHQLISNRKRPLEGPHQGSHGPFGGGGGGMRDMKPTRNLHVSNLAPGTTER